jgi:hypothetical protein
LKSRGKTNRAAGWLQPEYEVTTDFIRENAADGHLFPRGDFDEGNRPPVLTLTGGATVNFPGPAMLSLSATDDGRPRPAAPRAAPAAQQGQARRQPQALRVRWITYRGPARVTFDPETAGSPEGTAAKFETKAIFTAPGAYRLRAVVSDGLLYSTQDVDVTVKPGS